jgi:hypothetical protein
MEVIALSYEALVAFQQQVVILDFIIHSSLQCAKCLSRFSYSSFQLRVLHLELRNALAERRSIILGDDSFGNLSQFYSLVQKNKETLKTQQQTTK